MVVAQQKSDRKSNPRPLDRQSNTSVALFHRAIHVIIIIIINHLTAMKK